METTTWQRVLLVAAFVTIIFALLLCFAAGSNPAVGLELSTDDEMPWLGAEASYGDGPLTGGSNPRLDRILVEPTPTRDPDGYEPDDVKHQASPIALGDPQRHSFQRLDEDWVKFWAWAGNSYTISTFDLDNGCNTVLCLYHAAGAEETCDDNGGAEELASKIDWTPDYSGVYFVRVAPAIPWVSGNLSYTLVISEAARCSDPLEPDDTYQGARPITADAHTFHGPCGGDEDWISFQAVGEEVYAIWTSGLTGNNDTVLELYDDSGMPVTVQGDPVANDDYEQGVPASRIVWQAPADGTYLVRVAPFEPGAGGCDLGYTLHIDTLEAMPTPAPPPAPSPYEPDEYEPDDAMHQANRITPNSGLTQDHAFHAYQDQDWVKFWAWAGFTYTVKTEVGPGTATTLELHSADGQKLPVGEAENGDSAASEIEWKATESGSYFVKVTYPAAPGVRNQSPASPYGLTYSLVVSETIPCREAAYEPDDTRELARQITVGGDPQQRYFSVPCYDRYPAPDTADWVTFTAQAGATYEIRTFDLASRTDTVLALYDTAGSPVASNDDYADDSLASRIVWEAPTSGTCSVEVSPFEPRLGGCSASYSLEITRHPDHLYLPLVLKAKNRSPYPPSDPAPAPGAVDQHLDVDLSWHSGDPDVGDQVFYDIYLGTEAPPTYTETIGPYPAGQTLVTYDHAPLPGGKLYRWYVVARDERGGESRGPEEGWWDFTTCACPDAREPDDDMVHANPIDPGEPVIGYICQEHLHLEDGSLVERDWYAFEVDTLVDIEVDLDLPDGANYDLFLWVGHWAASEDPTPGVDEHISWSAERIGTYYVIVKSLGDYDNCDPYTLLVTLD